MSIITKPEDKAIFELSFKHIMGELSDAEYEAEAARLGTTPGKIEDRLRYFPRKYPLLASLN